MIRSILCAVAMTLACMSIGGCDEGPGSGSAPTTQDGAPIPNRPQPGEVPPPPGAEPGELQQRGGR